MDIAQALVIIDALAKGGSSQTGEAVAFTHPDTTEALLTAKIVLEAYYQKEQWSKQDNASLQHDFIHGLSITELAVKHAQTRSVIAARLVCLGLIQANLGERIRQAH